MEFVDLVTDRVQGGSLQATFVASRRDTRTALSDEITDALDRLHLNVLDGTAQRVAYVRSMADGQTVLDGYDEKAADEVRQLLHDVARLLTDTE
jgi:chromosome partitioning protein